MENRVVSFGASVEAVDSGVVDSTGIDVITGVGSSGKDLVAADVSIVFSEYPDFVCSLSVDVN